MHAILYWSLAARTYQVRHTGHTYQRNNMAVSLEAFARICFGVICGLGAISCLSRPDYNFPLFAFVYWQFFNIEKSRRKRHQIYILVFIALTCIQDLLYLMYWRKSSGSTIHSDALLKMLSLKIVNWFKHSYVIFSVSQL